MENPIAITALNDFTFCPASIYYHNIYADVDKMIFQDAPQVEGTNSHKSIDTASYSTSKDVVQGIAVYCERYNIVGKIDKYIRTSHRLVESKRKITKVYDGYILQIYGQYFALCEAGYEVDELALYSIVDNSIYPVPLPKDCPSMLSKFENTLTQIRNFRIENFQKASNEKCLRCIYSDICMFGAPL